MSTSAFLAQTQTAQRQVLLVDSGPEVNELLIEIFHEPEWQVLFADSNREALRLCFSNLFELIITGVRTSGHEDIQLLRQLRLVRPHARVIILADEFTSGDVLNAIRERAFSYFSPPFSPESLREMIHLALVTPAWDDGIEVLSATPSWVQLAVRCDLQTAHRLLQFFREASPFDDKETDEVSLAFREILINAMEYGGRFDPSQYVEVSYVHARRMVLCKVKDPGTGFSLDELKCSALSNPPSEPLRHLTEREAEGKRVGGFGIMMAKQLVDDLIYNQAGNEVLLVKLLDGTSRRPPA